MAAPRLEGLTAKDLTDCEETSFQKRLNELNMRGLLDLVSALQSAMAEEQRRFDLLSEQLLKCPEMESLEYKTITSALFSTQMRLTTLCNRNMQCFTQQAIRAKKDHWKATASSISDSTFYGSSNSPLVKIQKMPSPSVVSQDERSANGFRESLLFFRSQEQKVSSSTPTNETTKDCRRNVQFDRKDSKSNLGKTIPSPSVDNILNNVKSLCASQSARNPVTRTVIYQNRNVKTESSERMSKPVSKIIPIVSQSNINRKPSYTEDEDSDTARTTICNGKVTPGCLSSRFNPTFSPHDENISTLVNSSVLTRNGLRHSLSDMSSCNSLSDSNKNDSNEFSNTNEFTSELWKQRDKLPETGESRISPTVQNGTTTISRCSEISDEVEHQVSRNPITSHDNFLVLDSIQKVTALDKKSSFTENSCNYLNGNIPRKCSPSNTSTKTTGHHVQDKLRPTPCAKVPIGNYGHSVHPAEECELACDSIESDYDSQDFVVHKTTYSEDYLEAMSEDAYSSINEDYEVEYPEEFEDSDLPSPDYVSDEEDYRVHEGQLDDSTRYLAAEPCRYAYYHEDKELEVIPEEDEDDLEDEEDEDSFSSSKELVYANCKCPSDDSGVSEDHQSNCSSVNSLVTADIPASSGRNFTQDRRKWRSVDWDPVPLINACYKVPSTNEFTKEEIHPYKQDFIRVSKIQDLLEFQWKELNEMFVQLNKQTLQIYQDENSPNASWNIFLKNITIDTLSLHSLRIKDEKGQSISFYSSDWSQLHDWKQCFEHYTDTKCYTISPIERNLTCSLDIVVIDIGGFSVKAGIATSPPSLPAIYIPSVMLTNKKTKECSFDYKKLLDPERRKNYKLSYPFSRMDHALMELNVPVVRELINYVYDALHVDPSKFKLMLCWRDSLCKQKKSELMKLVFDLQIPAFSISHALTAEFCTFSANSGIVVDVGDEIKVMSVEQGFVPPFAFKASPHGCRRMMHHVKRELILKNNSGFDSILENFCLQYAMQNLCYLSPNIEEDKEKYEVYDHEIVLPVDMSTFFKEPNAPYRSLTLGHGRFVAPEGIFNPTEWGVDTPGLTDMIIASAKTCSVESHHQLYSSILLTGGVSLMPGFQDRLRHELTQLGIKPRIYSPKHAVFLTYMGAQKICEMKDSFITKDIYTELGPDNMERFWR